MIGTTEETEITKQEGSINNEDMVCTAILMTVFFDNATIALLAIPQIEYSMDEKSCFLIIEDYENYKEYKGIKGAKIHYCAIFEGKSSTSQFDIVFCTKPFVNTFAGVTLRRSRFCP